MRKFFSKDNPPSNYGLCMNHGCPRSATCLRYQLGKSPSSIHEFVTCLHPSHYPEGGQCKHYRNSAKVKVAWGVKYLWDNIPLKKAQEMKAKLISHFGRNLYYAFYRKDLPLYPDEQEEVQRLFNRYGITSEPSYESFSEEYLW